MTTLRVYRNGMRITGQYLDVVWGGEANGNVPIWNASLGTYVPGSPPGGAPSGAAGGELAGSYPNPTLATTQPSAHTWSALQTFSLGISIAAAQAIAGANAMSVTAVAGLTITAGAASTWSTSAGLLTVTGAAGVTLGLAGQANTIAGASTFSQLATFSAGISVPTGQTVAGVAELTLVSGGGSAVFLSPVAGKNGLSILSQNLAVFGNGDQSAAPDSSVTIRAPIVLAGTTATAAPFTRVQSGLGTGTGALGYVSLRGSVGASGTANHTVAESFQAYGQYVAITGGMVEHRTTVADAIYTALMTDQRIAYTSISATRIVTGPTPTTGYTIPAGFTLILCDESGSASGSVKIQFTPAAGQIDGGAGPADIVITARGSKKVYFDGTNWHSSAS